MLSGEEKRGIDPDALFLLLSEGAGGDTLDLSFRACGDAGTAEDKEGAMGVGDATCTVTTVEAVGAMFEVPRQSTLLAHAKTEQTRTRTFKHATILLCIGNCFLEQCTGVLWYLRQKADSRGVDRRVRQISIVKHYKRRLEERVPKTPTE